MIPTLYTDRLILRPYQRADFDAYADFMAGPRMQYMGGPIDTDKAWTWFTNDVATWALYGFGTLAIEMKGKFAGGVGLVHPPHFPEPECGWFMFDGYTGQGIATEAGRAIIAHTFASTPLDSFVSYIAKDNAASARTAEKLGSVLDHDAQVPAGETGTLVYRHSRNPAQRSVT